MALDEVDFFGGERVHNIEKLSKTSYNTIWGSLPVGESGGNVSSLHASKILIRF